MPTDLQPLGRAVKRLQHKHHRALDSRLAAIGTTLAQWDALRAIDQHPESSSHKLAGLTFQTDQSFGALANRMVDRGLIERVAGGGRVLLHRLTAEGRTVLAQGHEIANDMLAQSFAPLTAAQRKQLQGLLALLLADDD